MSELKTVRLGSILPNPHRDLDDWPTVKDKVEEIKASMDSTGFWDGYMIVRPGAKRGTYEQVFGHHRLVAARELWGDDHKVTVTVSELDDAEMYRRMVAENSETYGMLFYYAVMQPIARLVQLYGEGRVELNKPDVGGKHVKKSFVRYAPRYQPDTAPNDKPYTTESIGQYLGWVEAGQAARKVRIAMDALELVERKVLSRKDFLNKTQGQAKALVDLTRARMKAEQAEIDATVSVREEALERAEAEGDTSKIKRLEREIADLEADADKRLVKIGKSIGSAVSSELDDGRKPRELVEAYRPVKTEGTETRATKTANQECNDYTAKVEKQMLDTDPEGGEAHAGHRS
jgi:hypothetical protein